MTDRTYMKLPINPDEGFPQSFRLSFGGRTYQVLLYANIAEAVAEQPDEHVFELPDENAYLVMQVAREGTDPAQVIFQRKLVPDQAYEASELAFLFREMRVAKRNLNGVGAFGSSVIGGVAERWAS